MVTATVMAVVSMMAPSLLTAILAIILKLVLELTAHDCTSQRTEYAMASLSTKEMAPYTSSYSAHETALAFSAGSWVSGAVLRVLLVWVVGVGWGWVLVVGTLLGELLGVVLRILTADSCS